MIVRVSSSVVRGFLVLVAFLLAALFCYSGVRNALAQHYVELNTRDGYESAVRLEPDDPRNWYLLGRYWQYNLESPDTQRAILDYQRSLTLNPHSVDAWLDLATAYETEGDIGSARNAFQRAKQAYPLSPDVSWRYGNFLLRRNELDLAFSEFKQAVQRNPMLAASAFALSMRVQPDIHLVLDRALPASPNTLLNVIDFLSDQHKTGQALAVWARLAALQPHFPLRESYALLEALFQNRDVTEAQRVWKEALGFAGISPPPGIPGSLIWDGGFESAESNGGFAWRYPYPLPGGPVQVAADAKQKRSGNQSLRLTFNGLANVDFRDVCEFVAVQPSTSYRFSAWIRTEALSTDSGVRFNVTSIADGYPVSWTDDVRGTQPWTQVSLVWSSSPDVRLARICVARLTSSKFDNKIRGVAWIDDVALVPQLADNMGR